MKKMLIRKIPFIIGIAAVGIIVFGSAVMLLWNGILTSVLRISAITFWQATGILLLAKILFGGFRGRRWHGGWREKRLHWQNMTQEEKENFKGHCHVHYKTAGNEQ
jgi:Ca2+/H+ antiporter, TMEM165/GDT1 family